eukprot:scaffold30054_cov32-Tisochrysis_lutea.AAC.2
MGLGTLADGLAVARSSVPGGGGGQSEPIGLPARAWSGHSPVRRARETRSALLHSSIAALPMGESLLVISLRASQGPLLCG